MPLFSRSADKVKITGLILLGFSSCLFAASTPNTPSFTPPELARVSKATQSAMREQIMENAQNTFTLLGAELAADRGHTKLALNTYLSVLHNTQNPEVAGRALELAILTGDKVLADQLFQTWQNIEPNASPAQRRILWAYSLGQSDMTQTFTQLETIVGESSHEQIRQIFLILAQVSVQNMDMLRIGNKQVHRIVARYPNMVEAIVLDMVFSIGNRENTRTMANLKQLSKIDPHLSLPTRTVLDFLVKEQPEMLGQFFAKNNSLKLSPTWQELEIENLIQNKQYQRAQNRLHTLLAKQPNANLYFLAAAQAFEQNKTSNNHEAKQYLEKAYQLGTPEQQSRAAALMTLQALQQKNWKESEIWLNNIQSPDYEFDKSVLELSLASEQNNWDKVITLYDSQRDIKPSFLSNRLFDDVHREQLYFHAMMQTHNPKVLLNEINSLIKNARAQNDQVRIGHLLYQRGLLYVDKLQRVSEAIQDFRHYLAMNPDNPSVQNALGYTLLLSQPENLNEATEWITKAYQAQPESAAINDSMGWLYVQKGDYATAKLYLEYAYKNLPNAEIAAHLGELYWKLGQPERAKTIWKEGWLKNKNDKNLQDTLKKYQIKF